MFRRALAFVPWLLLPVVAGCGRSDLDDELGTDDGGYPSDDSGSMDAASTSDSIVPPDDVTVPPPYTDVSIPPPPYFDVSVPPPYEDGPHIVPPPFEDGSACGPSSCAGCCQADGTCLTNIAIGPGPCGANGETCTYCDQFCYMGGCGNLDSNCGPSNCNGCCAGNGACSDGTHGVACGSGGAQCETCDPEVGGGTCVANANGSGGRCVNMPSTCEATSCPSGCCIMGICAEGSQDIACGTGGAACTDCTSSGLTCLFQQCGGGFNH